MAATDSKMKDHSLHSVSRPEKVGHLFNTRGSTCPCECHCRLNSSSLGLRRQSLRLSEVLAHFPPVPGPTAPPLPCSISTTIQHNCLKNCKIWTPGLAFGQHKSGAQKVRRSLFTNRAQCHTEPSVGKKASRCGPSLSRASSTVTLPQYGTSAPVMETPALRTSSRWMRCAIQTRLDGKIPHPHWHLRWQSRRPTRRAASLEVPLKHTESDSDGPIPTL